MSSSSDTLTRRRLVESFKPYFTGSIRHMSHRAIRLHFEKLAKIPMPSDANRKKLLIVEFTDYYGQEYSWAPKWEDLVELVRDSLITETLNNRPLKTRQFIKAIRGIPAIKELLITEKVGK